MIPVLVPVRSAMSAIRTCRYPTSVISYQVAFKTSSRRSASTLGRGLIEPSFLMRAASKLTGASVYM